MIKKGSVRYRRLIELNRKASRILTEVYAPHIDKLHPSQKALLDKIFSLKGPRRK